MSLLNIESLRKWLYKPKKDDTSLYSQFYFADEELNIVASELDSFDGRKDPERCTSLVSQLRQCQDKVLGICNQIIEEVIPEERTNREFRAKFPDDVVTDSLPGELWFGAECLAAGSTIVNRELESARLRPLAKAVTKSLDHVRCLLRLHCMRINNNGSDRISDQKTKEALKVFDRLFADFELSYVGCLVPVKSSKEFHLLQDVTVLMSETLKRAMKTDFITQEMVDDCEPALMFSIPRLAIVWGLLYYPEGALNIDVHTSELSELFRPFQSLLFKIRSMLRTLSENELNLLEKALLSSDETMPFIDSEHKSDLQFDDYLSQFYKSNTNCKKFISDFYSYNCGMSSNPYNVAPLSQSEDNCLHSNEAGSPTSLHSELCFNSESNEIDAVDSKAESDRSSSQMLRSSRELSSLIDISTLSELDIDGSSTTVSNRPASYSSSSLPKCNHNSTKRCFICMSRQRNKRRFTESSASMLNKSYSSQTKGHSEPTSPMHVQKIRNVLPSDIHVNMKEELVSLSLNESSIARYDASSSDESEDESIASSCSTSPNYQDDEEIALAIQAAEIEWHHQMRCRFRNTYDLIHRLFVCISGVADQLQSNFASDLRNILKIVFEINSSQPCSTSKVECSSQSNYETNSNSNYVNIDESDRSNRYNDNILTDFGIENGEDALAQLDNINNNPNMTTQSPPIWVPDNESSSCMECYSSFTILRRRHHCRNCGKIFCSKCCSNWIPIPHYGHKQPVRVCNPCFACQTEQIPESLRVPTAS